MSKPILDYHFLKSNNLILFEVISGSIAYGTNLISSDSDRRYVYILPIDYLLSDGMVEQVNDQKNDVVGYEIGRFLDLLSKQNPNIIELLNVPDDCLIFKDPAFNIVLENKNKFLTKLCANTFAGYAISQIKKAKSGNKKQNWEKEKITRKDVLDFVFVLDDSKSIPWKVWSKNKYDSKFCGVVNIENCQNVYSVFYDFEAHNAFSDLVPENIRNEYVKLKKDSNSSMGFGYKGIIKSDEENKSESNSLRLSSIPKGEKPICNIFYNKDSYSQHCRDYKSYLDWINCRNEQRWIDVVSHGQKIDGKNLLHLVRLLKMSREIAEGHGVIVRRPDREELLKIRSGEVDLQSIIDWGSKEIEEVDAIFSSSNLPDCVDSDFVSNLLLNIRKSKYNLN